MPAGTPLGARGENQSRRWFWKTPIKTAKTQRIHQNRRDKKLRRSVIILAPRGNAGKIESNNKPRSANNLCRNPIRNREHETQTANPKLTLSQKRHKLRALHPEIHRVALNDETRKYVIVCQRLTRVKPLAVGFVNLFRCAET
jgi:hypothetical protein